MAATNEVPPAGSLHPFHAVMLAGTIPLFLGALLSDVAYWKSYEIQWTNFAQWLLAGGLLFGGIALACALAGLFRADRRGGRSLLYFVVLLAMWVLGFADSLVHARDAFATMPSGLALSALVAVLALVATWLGFAAPRSGVGS